jgi:hypothetical protein
VGALIFTGALPQLLSSILSFYSSLIQITGRNQYSDGTQYYNWRALFIAVGTFLKAALGLWMFFGAHGFSNFWRLLRNFGTPNPPMN